MIEILRATVLDVTAKEVFSLLHGANIISTRLLLRLSFFRSSMLILQRVFRNTKSSHQELEVFFQIIFLIKYLRNN